MPAPLTSESLDEFADLNDAMAIIAPKYLQIVGADGRLSQAEIDAVREDPDLLYTDAEVAAFEHVLTTLDGSSDGVRDVDDIQRFTQALLWRGVLAGDPKLAQQWIWVSGADPTGVASEHLWRDEAGASAWLRAALASTNDPNEQFELIVSFLDVYQQTTPDDSPLGMVHQLLDGFGVVDPTPGLRRVERHHLHGRGRPSTPASRSAPPPCPSSPAGRCGSSDILRSSTGVAAPMPRSSGCDAVRARCSPTTCTRFADNVAAEFGDDFARAVRRRIDDLLAKAETAGSYAQDRPPARGGSVGALARRRRDDASPASTPTTSWPATPTGGGRLRDPPPVRHPHQRRRQRALLPRNATSAAAVADDHPRWRSAPPTRSRPAYYTWVNAC